ncbi:hypothetical protein [Halomonas sp. A29]|uniref:hypothetical protein n=1 Tax=Halomonas sp. A29 TaxID=3102786 RepID=UPI00398A70E7
MVRSTQIISKAPAFGPVLPLLATSIGQVAGSPLAGRLVGAEGHVATFMLFASRRRAWGVVAEGEGQCR